MGFATLICKDWLSFGHRFATRCGLGVRDHKDYCPIFVQFIDCVYQIARKFPTAFDFNNAFLVALVDAVYSVDSATFCCDSEKETLLRFYSRDGSRSVWDSLIYAEDAAAKYGNPQFKPDASQQLLFKPFSWNVKFFEALYLRHLN